MRTKRVTRKSKSVYQTKANYNSQLSYRDTAKQLTEFQPVSSKIQTTKFIKPANYHQRDYIDSIKNNVVSIVLGPSGTGKNLIALSQAIALFNSDNSPIDKIYYLRGNIGMSHEKSLGAIPGELSDKVMQLAYPVLDNLVEFMSEGQAKYLIESKKIEILPIEMIRGRSFKNAFIIFDECQNATLHHIKTVLTRISEGSKMVLTGDYSQCDFKDSSLSGILQAANKLKGTPGVGVIEFTIHDIVRHPIISHILERL